MDALRRSTWELWQYFEELSFNTLLYRGPAITHPSVGFYLSLNIQFVVLGISPFLALRSWPFFEQEHRACGKTTGLATHQPISHLHGQVPQVLVIAQLTLSLPAFYLYRRLGAAVFLKRTFPLETSSRLIQLCRRLLSTTSTSTAVWVPLWFRYRVFSISYYFPHLFRFANRLFFLRHISCHSCAVPVVPISC